ncbi:amino-acid N-acetyltransferase [Marinospirillum sp. MEB164]|uniref:Amino-acid acetyltransferase n=1 Tax=Marinospirillum alkalitolerans TaxID=3123374 RepID=A0ABW8PXK7_9GAMM
MSQVTPEINWFRQAAPYIHAHRGRVFVVHLEGDALIQPFQRELMTDLALLYSLGIKLVITFGARPQLAQALEAQDLPWLEHQGRLLIDPPRLPSLIQTLGTLRVELERRLSMSLSQASLQHQGVQVVSGNLVMARPLGVREGVDFHFSGEVRRIQVEPLKRLLDQGNIVLLPPLGYSATGEAFDLDAEEVATAAAIELKADKLLLLGRAEGLHDAQGQLIRDITPLEAEHWPHVPEYGCLARHLQAACTACRRGVKRAHLLSYQHSGSLLEELFTREGAGTLITQYSYETLRQAKIEDVGGLLALLRPLEEKGVLVRRSRELLEAEIDRFTVIDLDGSIIACAALYPYPDEQQAELACVVVDPEYRQGQRGDRLLAKIEKTAKQQGIMQLFVLTTHTAHWFIERGFEPAAVEDLPTSRRALYNWQRNSKVFCKQL